MKTIQDVKDDIEAIKHYACNKNDPEMAHGMEDDMFIDVLRAIADGAPDAQELAREAIKSVLLDYPRWYA
jgi:hypothetical protein